MAHMKRSKCTTLAIHHRPGSFSDRWIEYCTENSIRYDLVNCYDSDIIQHLRSCAAFLWHWNHYDCRARLFARQLTYSLEAAGKLVFPNSRTCWHFDDKVGQKYLLEAIGAPLVPSYVFYDEEEAMEWAGATDYPKVFKLRGGAGSSNVLLVRTRSEAARLIRKAFGAGFSPINRRASLRDSISAFHHCRTHHTARGLIGALFRCVIPGDIERRMGRERGYVYFQDFIPGNKHDTRVVVIGNRAFAFQREVRRNDFRASGSGSTILDRKKIDTEFIRLAYEVSRRLNLQSTAYDFIRDESRGPHLIEMSYAFPANGQVAKCPGHWDGNLKWHDGKMWPQDAILEDMLAQIAVRSAEGI